MFDSNLWPTSFWLAREMDGGAPCGKFGRVLLVNVGPPTFVSFLSTVHILSCSCPVSVYILSHFCPLSHFCLLSVLKFSVLSCSGLDFVIIGLKIVPLLSPFGPLSPSQMVRTNTGQKWNWIIFPFSTWSPCRGTKMGQKLDTCPKFVLYLSMHPIHFTIVSIFAHMLDKMGQ